MGIHIAFWWTAIMEATFRASLSSFHLHHSFLVDEHWPELTGAPGGCSSLQEKLPRVVKHPEWWALEVFALFYMLEKRQWISRERKLGCDVKSLAFISYGQRVCGQMWIWPNIRVKRTVWPNQDNGQGWVHDAGYIFRHLCFPRYPMIGCGTVPPNGYVVTRANPHPHCGTKQGSWIHILGNQN